MGLIHVYTGEGKGKTTAALGLALRAKSRGFKVLFAQFMKSSVRSSELQMLKKLSICIKNFDSVSSPLFSPGTDRIKIRENVMTALNHLKKIMASDDFDLIILDEFNCILSESLITDEEAMDFIARRPERLELVLTGRGATDRLVDLADYVTYMKSVKHPFGKGLKARKGIEF